MENGVRYNLIGLGQNQGQGWTVFRNTLLDLWLLCLWLLQNVYILKILYIYTSTNIYIHIYANIWNER